MILSGHPLPAPIPPAQVLARGLAADADAPALVSADATLTWRELDAASARYAAGLLGRGLAPGDRVASLMPNRPALVVHYLGCLRAGLVPTPLNYRYTAPEIDHALTVSGARLLLAHRERRADLAASKGVAALPLGVIDYAEDGGSGFDALLATDPPLPAGAPAPAPTDPAVIFFTSGSTGLPKGVTHSHATLGCMLASAGAGIGLTAADRLLPGSSLSHIAGLAWTLAALAAQARVVISHTADGDELLGLLRRERPTVLTMLPSALFMLVRDHAATHADFASLRLVRAAGDKVATELEREFLSLAGFLIDEGFGITEAGFVLITPPGEPIRVGSVGRPMPGVEVALRGEDGADVPAGAAGALWVRSPSNTVGYWGDPAATAALFRDGWLDSGDLMRADTDGYCWFEGRKKQIIVHDSSNICPQEVEDALLLHPAVAAAGVVGVHDLVHGENVRAYVSLRPDVPRPTAQEIIRTARSRVGYKAPEEVIFFDHLPFTASGKVDRTALARLAEGHLSG